MGPVMNIALAVLGVVILTIALIRIGQSIKSWWPLLGTFDKILFAGSIAVIGGFGVVVFFDMVRNST